MVNIQSQFLELDFVLFHRSQLYSLRLSAPYEPLHVFSGRDAELAMVVLFDDRHFLSFTNIIDIKLSASMV